MQIVWECLRGMVKLGCIGLIMRGIYFLGVAWLCPKKLSHEEVVCAALLGIMAILFLR